jgi:hypothetical protein
MCGEGFPLQENRIELQLWTLPGCHGNACARDSTLQLEVLGWETLKECSNVASKEVEAIWEDLNLDLGAGRGRGTCRHPGSSQVVLTTMPVIAPIFTALETADGHGPLCRRG